MEMYCITQHMHSVFTEKTEDRIEEDQTKEE